MKIQLEYIIIIIIIIITIINTTTKRISCLLQLKWKFSISSCHFEKLNIFLTELCCTLKGKWIIPFHVQIFLCYFMLLSPSILCGNKDLSRLCVHMLLLVHCYFITFNLTSLDLSLLQFVRRIKFLFTSFKSIAIHYKTFHDIISEAVHNTKHCVHSKGALQSAIPHVSTLLGHKATSLSSLSSIFI